MYCDLPVLGRCCFCMPLRRGILTFGYINLVLSAIMVGGFSYAIHFGDPGMVIYRGISTSLPTEICIALHCADLVVNAILIYGAHKVLQLPLKMYYYYSISTIFASLLIQIIDIISMSNREFYPGHIIQRVLIEEIPLLLLSLFLEIYLIILVRSLLRKMEQSGTGNYDNPLQQVVYEGAMAPNCVYNDPTTNQMSRSVDPTVFWSPPDDV